jgi:hypothetical protein
MLSQHIGPPESVQPLGFLMYRNRLYLQLTRGINNAPQYHLVKRWNILDGWAHAVTVQCSWGSVRWNLVCNYVRCTVCVCVCVYVCVCVCGNANLYLRRCVCLGEGVRILVDAP